MAKPSSGPPWWVTAIAVIAVPILVALITTVVTQYYTATEKSREQDIHMVEIGVSLIAPDPSNDPKRGGARSWALDVMEKYSGVRFSTEARDLIIGNSVQVDKQILPGTSSQPQAPIVPETPPGLPFVEPLGLDEFAILDDPGHVSKWTNRAGNTIDFTAPVTDTFIKSVTQNMRLLGGHIRLATTGAASTEEGFFKYLKVYGTPVDSGTCFNLLGQFAMTGFLFGKITKADCPTSP
jgi:hypothetical protein